MTHRESIQMAFFELRQYVVRRGKKKEWLRMFDEEIMPFEVARGVVPCGIWHGESDDSVFIWMRRFNSEKERVRLCNAVYEDPYWLNELVPRIDKLVDRKKTVVQRIVANKKSSVQ
jgi:hypothetical protein